ncbi:MAG: hypothetical protein ACRDBM_02315, partial [Sporomusa sp.]
GGFNLTHTGKTCNRITLTPNTMDSIQYLFDVRHPPETISLDVANYGGGDVYINWRGDASIDGEDSLLLKEGVAYEVRERNNMHSFTLNIISDSAAVVQVVKSR